ncbi:MAG: SDR family oxidoreductase [Rhodospirillales bacterium]|nr:SDR family oxidoreductase [Rhodospirillales bacterium]
MAPPVLILGGSGGIGFALAKRMISQGRPIVIAARHGDRLNAAAQKLGGVPSFQCDTTDAAALSEAVAKAAGTEGLSGVAYCVGSIVLKPLKRATVADFTEAFILNAVGAAVAVQAAEPALRSARGSVILFSTVAAQAGFPNHSVIAAAKGAVEALTRSLAADLAPDVRVNCISPSLIRTPLAATLTANETVAKSIAALHPIPRLGEVDDIASLAALLLSPESGWITGQIIGVDGGRSTVRTKG